MSNLSPDDFAVTRAFLPPVAPAEDALTVGYGSGETATAPPPATLPGYQLLRELGRGGMGVVYLAKQDGLNRQVALKMVLSGVHASETDKSRFLAEAESVAAVRHPGVVQVFDFGTHEGRPYFALEFLSGGSLGTKLNGTPLPAKEAAKLVESIARAVQAAHDSGVIHRDLKPGNILFDSDGVAKVTDFGLARKSDNSSALTQTGAILGTPSYMAPEQAEGRRDVGPSADVYAVGAILYECLTGRPPFRAATPLETIHQVLKDEPVPPSRFHPRLPRDLETVCLKCLRKDPRKRYESAAALADDLQRFRTGEPIVARPVSLLEKYWRSVRRRPALNALILLTAVSIGVAIGVLTGANKNLRRKQEALEKETAAARTAEADADTQRKKAQERLEKAIEAVDRMMTRVGSERWATNPALQDERQKVLEDAVAFFNGFSGEDSADPMVRKEAAKAQNRVAGAHLMLGDTSRSLAANREAVRLYDGLIVEFPDDPEYPSAASEAHALAGGAASLSGQYADALVSYQRAVELADAARSKNPDSAHYKLRAVEARSSLGYFYLQSNRIKGEEVLETMMRLAREIGEAPDAKYEHRVSLAFALCVAATYDQSGSKLPDAQAKYGEANAVLSTLSGQTAPSARAWDQRTHTQALVTVQLAFITILQADTPAKRRAGAKQMKDGLEQFDTLLKVNPKAFQYRLQKYNALRSLASVFQMLNEPTEAKVANIAADRLIAEMLKENPNLTWLKGIDAVRQTTVLIERIRSGDPIAFEAEADGLLAMANGNSNKGDVVYNVACVYAVASEKRATKAEEYAARAMAILNDLSKSTYFKTPRRVRHLDGDSDLDPLRERDDFKTFLEAVRKDAVVPNSR